MEYSGLLNGYWEEGYHYYIEIRDDELTLRNYMRKVDLRTRISYDADRLEAGERTVISLENNIISRDVNGSPFDTVKELAYENGVLKFLEYYTINGETLYTLEKTDHGPFDRIVIRDEEYRGFLQGEWNEWRTDGKGSILTVTGDRLSWLGSKDLQFHVISYRDSPNDVLIVPEDLTESSFPGFGFITVRPDMLTTYMMVYDMNMPMTVFARADMMNKIEIPAAAKTEPRNTMTAPPDAGMVNNWLKFPGMTGMNGMLTPAAPGQKAKKPSFCPDCGYRIEKENAKFCPNCGNKLAESGTK